MFTETISVGKGYAESRSRQKSNPDFRGIEAASRSNKKKGYNYKMTQSNQQLAKGIYDVFCGGAGCCSFRDIHINYNVIIPLGGVMVFQR